MEDDGGDESECEQEKSDSEGEQYEEGEEEEKQDDPEEVVESLPPVPESDTQLVASQDISDSEHVSVGVAGDDENSIPDDEQWSQVSSSWLARAYMNPVLKKDPDFETPRQPVEFRAKKEEPAPTETDDVSPSPSAEHGIEDEESDAETFKLEDVWTREADNANPNPNNTFNREALIRLMASMCEKEFQKRLGLKFNPILFLFYNCFYSLSPYSETFSWTYTSTIA